MSIFGEYNFGYNLREEEEKRKQRMLDLRRAAARNLSDIRAGKFRKEPKPKKKTELEQAFAWEIQLGHDVLERRELNKILNKLLMKEKLTPEEAGAAEEYQYIIDKYDAALEAYDSSERRRFVRLWNKSRKVKYSMGDK